MKLEQVRQQCLISIRFSQNFPINLAAVQFLFHILPFWLELQSDQLLHWIHSEDSRQAGIREAKQMTALQGQPRCYFAR